MKKTISPYYVLAVEDASPILRKFKTKKAAQAFVDDFKATHGTKNDGYWVDLFFQGKVFEADSCFQDDV